MQVWMRAMNRCCGHELRKPSEHSAQVGVVLTVLLVCAHSERLSAEPLGRSWPARHQISMDKIGHSSFDGLLRKYVDTDGYVDYTAWKASHADRQTLIDYLVTLGKANPQALASKQAKLAFWINAYNAVTIEGILREYPTSSIRNHTARLVGYNIWKDLPLIVGGRQYSLDSMEHQVLRKMNEPRIHFAIVCASIGCPRLLNRAYVSDRLDEQLTGNARDFFSRAQNLRTDSASGTLLVSSILDWFGEDFGSSTKQQGAYLKPYLPAAAQRVVDSGRLRFRYLDYNWNLNDQKSKRHTGK